MIELCNGRFLIIESRDDYKDYIWEAELCTRIDCGVIYHRGNKNYPQFYKIDSPFDGHFCSSYYPCTKKDIISYYEEMRDDINKTIKMLNDLQELA